MRHTTRPCEYSQRGWNGTPAASATRLGGCPGIGCSHSWSASSRARLFSRPSVYGCRGALKIVKTSAELDDVARVHDDDAVGELRDQAEVVRDQDDRGVRLLPRGLQHLHDLRLDRHVERGRRLVGDQHLRIVGDRHGDHGALPHAAGELVRILVDAPLGERDADELEELDRRASARHRRPCRVVDLHRLARSGRRSSAPDSARSSDPGRSSPSRRRGSSRISRWDSFSRSRPL